MITDTCEFVYEHHAGGDLEFDVHSIGGGEVDTIPTPATVLSQLSKQDLLRETYYLAHILMCQPSLCIIQLLP